MEGHAAVRRWTERHRQGDAGPHPTQPLRPLRALSALGTSAPADEREPEGTDPLPLSTQSPAALRECGRRTRRTSVATSADSLPAASRPWRRAPLMAFAPPTPAPLAGPRASARDASHDAGSPPARCSNVQTNGTVRGRSSSAPGRVSLPAHGRGIGGGSGHGGLRWRRPATASTPGTPPPATGLVVTCVCRLRSAPQGCRLWSNQMGLTPF